jgi:YD repeat-containing protein
MNGKHPAGTLTGRHAPGGEVLEYYYFASWTRNEENVKWSADIHRDGQSIFEVAGVVEAVEVSEENRNVRLAIEAAIEAGAELQAQK